MHSCAPTQAEGTWVMTANCVLIALVGASAGVLIAVIVRSSLGQPVDRQILDHMQRIGAVRPEVPGPIVSLC